MSGIRIINAPPETFRFPEWRDDIFFVKDSVVRYASYMAPSPGDSDSDNLVTKFYVALADVDPGDGIPPLRADKWGQVAESAATVGSIVGQIIDNDSDISWLRDNIPHIQLERDSDVVVIRVDHDSDKSMTYHDFKAADSDITVKLNDLDSDLLMINHDYQASDSELVKNIDSDIRKTIHDYQASDSELVKNIDSDINNLKNFDSDFAVDYDSDRHDFKSADSDFSSFLFAPSWDYGSNF